jgi:hypothetical protein
VGTLLAPAPAVAPASAGDVPATCGRAPEWPIPGTYTATLEHSWTMTPAYPDRHPSGSVEVTGRLVVTVEEKGAATIELPKLKTHMLMGTHRDIQWIEETLEGSFPPLSTAEGMLSAGSRVAILGRVKGTFAQTDGGAAGVYSIRAAGSAGTTGNPKAHGDDTRLAIYFTRFDCQNITVTIKGDLVDRLFWMTTGMYKNFYYRGGEDWTATLTQADGSSAGLWAKYQARLEAKATGTDEAARTAFRAEVAAVYSDIRGRSDLSEEVQICLEDLLIKWWYPRMSKMRKPIVDDIISAAKASVPDLPRLNRLFSEWIADDRQASVLSCPVDRSELARCGQPLDGVIAWLVAGGECGKAISIEASMYRLGIPSPKGWSLEKLRQICSRPPPEFDSMLKTGWGSGGTGGMKFLNEKLADGERAWVASGSRTTIEALALFLATQGCGLEGGAK